MTHRERIVAASRGEPVDMVPVSPRIAAYLIWKYGDASWKTALSFQEELDQDLNWQVGSGLPNPLDHSRKNFEYSPDVRYENNGKIVARSAA